jgi:hypothetical protein
MRTPKKNIRDFNSEDICGCGPIETGVRIKPVTKETFKKPSIPVKNTINKIAKK